MKILQHVWRKRPLYKPQATPDGLGTMSVPDGHEEFAFEADVDMAALYRLADRAAYNKGGKAKAGPLTVKIMAREKVA